MPVLTGDILHAEWLERLVRLPCGLFPRTDRGSRPATTRAPMKERP